MAQPVIEAGDITSSTSGNTADEDALVSHPAYNEGDLLIAAVGRDDDLTAHTLGLPSTGPNGETLAWSQSAFEPLPTSNGGPAVAAVAWIGGAGGGTAGTITFTIGNGSEQWAGKCVKVLSGEFDSTTPIGASGTETRDASVSGNTEVPTVGFTAGVTDGDADATVLSFMFADLDTIGGTVTGWDLLAADSASADVKGAVAVRQAAATNSESITNQNYTISNDSAASVAVTVRGPAAANTSIEVPLGPVW